MGALLLALTMAPALPAAAVTPQHFSQDDSIAARPGLVAADVGEVVWSGQYLWVATAAGLARLDTLQHDGRSEDDWVTFDTSHLLA